MTPPTIIRVLGIKENFEKPALKKIVKRSYNRRKLMNLIMVFSTPDSKSKNWLGMEIDATCKNAIKKCSKPIEVVNVNLPKVKAIVPSGPL